MKKFSFAFFKTSFLSLSLVLISTLSSCKPEVKPHKPKETETIVLDQTTLISNPSYGGGAISVGSFFFSYTEGRSMDDGFIDLAVEGTLQNNIAINHLLSIETIFSGSGILVLSEGSTNNDFTNSVILQSDTILEFDSFPSYFKFDVHEEQVIIEQIIITYAPNLESVNQRLKTPVLKLNEETGVVTWDSIPHASHYEYRINGGEIQETILTTYELDDKENISVRAIGAGYPSSDWSLSKAIHSALITTIGLEKTTAIVYFVDTSLSPEVVNIGSQVNRPSTDPIKTDYLFAGWYQDPYRLLEFDFTQPILEKTLIYPKWEPKAYRDGLYFLKGSEKISGTSSLVTTGGWKFTPFVRYLPQTQYVEFVARITVNNSANKSNPAEFIVMDGYDDSVGRLYYKNGNANFTIDSPGIYDVYFSVEHTWGTTNKVHAFVAPVTSSATNIPLNASESLPILASPEVKINERALVAYWARVPNAELYAYVKNNENMLHYTTESSVPILEGEKISVFALASNHRNSPYSRVVFCPYLEINEYVMVFFLDSDLPSIRIKKGETVFPPDNLVRTDYVFYGWYRDVTRREPFDFNLPIMEDTIIYPRWIPVYAYDTTEWFYAIDENDNTLGAFLINPAVLTHNEYLSTFEISQKTVYYVVDRNKVKTYGPYTLERGGKYTIYFSDEYVWNPQTKDETHVYPVMVSGKVDVYFSNDTNDSSWKDVYCYMFGNTVNNGWPGIKMTFVRFNQSQQSIYKINIDLSLYHSVIFGNGQDGGGKNQSVSINIGGIIAQGNNAFSTNGGKTGSDGKYTLIPYLYQ